MIETIEINGTLAVVPFLSAVWVSTGGFGPHLTNDSRIIALVVGFGSTLVFFALVAERER